MNQYIDIYCERLEPGLWAEPLNAVSNIAFFIAAYFAYRLIKREGAAHWSSITLATLILAMGIGSTLFHTFAVTWAMLADVLPILAFQIVFIVVYSQKVIGLKWRWCFALLAVFILTMQGAMALPREWLNGTLEYAPALIFVTGLGLYHLKHATRERFGLLTAAGVFVVSMSLRSIDMQICEAFPYGSHYAWHALNGLVLYLSTRAYVLEKDKFLHH